MNKKRITTVISVLGALMFACVHASEGIRQMIVRVEQICPTPVVENTPTISAPGYYALGQDITGPVTIDADDVTFDLNGYAITSDTYGIQNAGTPRNLILRDGSITGSGVAGIWLSDYQNVVIEDILVDGQYDLGISLTACTDVVVQNCRVNQCQYSVYLIGSSHCLVQDCMAARASRYGFFSAWCSDVQVCRCRAIDLSAAGNVYGFYSGTNSDVDFSQCICQNASADPGPAGGFYYYGTDGRFSVRDCLVTNITSPGRAYGILCANPYDSFSEQASGFSVTGTVTDGTIVDDVSWSPTGTYLAATGAFDGNGALWLSSFSGGALGSPTRTYIDARTTKLAWSPDGSAIAVAGYQTTGPVGKLYVYPVSGGVVGTPTELTIESQVRDISWSPDSAYLAVVGVVTGDTGFVHVYSYVPGTPPALTLKTSSATSYAGISVSFSHDGVYLAASGVDAVSALGYLATYEWQAPSTLRILQTLDFDLAVSTVAWSPVENLLACANLEGGDSMRVAVYEMRQNNIFEQTSITQSAWFGANLVENPRVVSWSLDGKYLSTVHRYLGAGMNDQCYCYISLYSVAGNLLSTDDLLTSSALFQWTTAWHPSSQYFVTGGRRTDNLTGFVDLYSVVRDTSGSASRGVLTGNIISQVHGTAAGVGILGVSGDNFISRNVAYDNDTNFGEGLDNVATGYGAVPGLLDNISLPG